MPGEPPSPRSLHSDRQQANLRPTAPPPAHGSRTSTPPLAGPDRIHAPVGKSSTRCRSHARKIRPVGTSPSGVTAGWCIPAKALQGCIQSIPCGVTVKRPRGTLPAPVSVRAARTHRHTVRSDTPTAAPINRTCSEDNSPRASNPRNRPTTYLPPKTGRPLPDRRRTPPRQQLSSTTGRDTPVSASASPMTLRTPHTVRKSETRQISAHQLVKRPTRKPIHHPKGSQRINTVV